MKRQARWQRWFARALLAGGLAGTWGCVDSLHRLPPLEHAEPCQAVAVPARNHVYIVLVGGLEPAGMGDLAALRNYLHNLGFYKTYYGQFYHAGHFGSEVRRVHQEDPEAQFVLIGWNGHHSSVRNLARTLQSEEVPVALVACLNSNIKDTHCRKQGDSDPQMIHLGVAHDPETLQTLAWQLAAIAGGIPVPLPETPAAPPGTETLPTPRPAPEATETLPMPRVLTPEREQDTAKTEGWDLLKPATQLRQLPAMPQIAVPQPAAAKDSGLGLK